MLLILIPIGFVAIFIVDKLAREALVDRLENEHPEFLEELQVGQPPSEPPLDLATRLLTQYFVRSKVPEEIYFVHPNSGDWLPFEQLLRDRALLARVGDPRIDELCLRRVRTRQARIVFLGSIPLLIFIQLGFVLY